MPALLLLLLQGTCICGDCWPMRTWIRLQPLHAFAKPPRLQSFCISVQTIEMRPCLGRRMSLRRCLAGRTEWIALARVSEVLRLLGNARAEWMSGKFFLHELLPAFFFRLFVPQQAVLYCDSWAIGCCLRYHASCIGGSSGCMANWRNSWRRHIFPGGKPSCIRSREGKWWRCIKISSAKILFCLLSRCIFLVLCSGLHWASDEVLAKHGSAR